VMDPHMMDMCVGVTSIIRPKYLRSESTAITSSPA